MLLHVSVRAYYDARVWPWMCSEEEFKALFVEKRALLQRRARQLLGARSAEVDDVVHTAYLKAHGYLRSGRFIRDPYQFLCRTVNNLVTDGYRKTKIRGADSSIDVGDVAPGSPSSSVEREVILQSEFERICIATARLPTQQRRAFVLKKVFGHTHREIAERMGISENTVMRHVADATKTVISSVLPADKPRGTTEHRKGAGVYITPVRDCD